MAEDRPMSAAADARGSLLWGPLTRFALVVVLLTAAIDQAAKLWLLHAMKKYWGPRVTTVWPKQGHYAIDERVRTIPPPDVSIDRIGELLAWSGDGLLQAGRV